MIDQILHDLDQFERRARAIAVKLAARARASASRQLVSGSIPEVSQELAKLIVPLLEDVMVASHLKAMRREQLIVSNQGIKLSSFDSSINSLQKLMNLSTDEVNRIQRKYRTNALRVVYDVSRLTEEKLRQKTLQLIDEGRHVKDGVKEMRKAFDELGLTKTADFRLAAIFRTQSQIAYNAGRYEADQDPAVQEILWGYKYVTVGDDRVRPEHQKLDGVTLPKEDPFWLNFWPPNGWNCRCQVIPIFKSTKIKQAPRDVLPDRGFDVNFGLVLSIPSVRVALS